MEQEDYEWERNKILSEINGYDSSYRILHFDSWSSYDEHGWMFVFEKDSQYWLLEYQYSVFAEDNTPVWQPHQVSADEAVAAMLDWEQAGKDVSACM